jgi:hypothetical protein
VSHEVGVERVVGRDEHREGLLTRPPRATGLLPEARPAARPPRHDDRVETADVDAQLEGVGGGQPPHRAVAQPALELAPVLREVTPPVCRDTTGPLGVELFDPPPRVRRERLRPGATAREGDGLHAVEDELGEDLGRLGRRGPPASVLGRGLPQGEGHRPARRAVVCEGGDRHTDES